MSHRISTIYTLNENCGIWILATILRRNLNTTHWSGSDYDVGKVTAVGDTVVDYRKENYKTDFEIWNKNYKIQSERENIEMSRPTLAFNRDGAKSTDPKTPATEFSALKEKSRK